MQRVTCTQCHAEITVGDEARRVCAYLSQRLGHDPLCLRWPLAVRGVGQTRAWACLACTRGVDAVTGCVFLGDKEYIRSQQHLSLLQGWFGTDVFIPE